MNWRDNMRMHYNRFGMTEKLIAINLLVFLVFNVLLQIFGFLFQFSVFETVDKWLILPSDLQMFVTRPWTIITYAFMHAGFWHILMNMLILYFSGHFFLTYFSPKRLLNYYFLGAIAGALFFMASYNIFPAFSDGKHYELLGASAAVMAILVGVATFSPNMRIPIFMWHIKLWWIAAFFVGKDLIMIPGPNPGGHIAHLGGAALGFIYSRQLTKGVDIGLWFEKLMDWFVGLFSARPKNPFKKVYKNKSKPTGQRGPYNTSQQESADKQKKVDAILDKISKNGYDSLTQQEKEFLFNVGDD